MELRLQRPDPGVSGAYIFLKSEATFRETVEIARQLRAGRVIFSHIEEPDGLSYDDLCRVESELRTSGLDARFAFDSMVIEV